MDAAAAPTSTLGSIFADASAYADPVAWHATAQRIREESPILLVAVLYFTTKISRSLLFWAAYVLTRPLVGKVQHQALVLGDHCPREQVLDLPAGGCCIGQRLRVERPGRPGDVEDAEQLTVGRVMDRGGGAGPTLHVTAEVLECVNLHGLPRCDGGSDGVGANIGLVPTTAALEVHAATVIAGTCVSGGLKNETRGVCEDKH